VQRDGGPIEKVRAGDVMWFHRARSIGMASPTNCMTHIVVQETLNGKNVERLEKVSDQQYRK